jgi:hypothetical protein
MVAAPTGLASAMRLVKVWPGHLVVSDGSVATHAPYCVVSRSHLASPCTRARTPLLQLIVVPHMLDQQALAELGFETWVFPLLCYKKVKSIGLKHGQ